MRLDEIKKVLVGFMILSLSLFCGTFIGDSCHYTYAVDNNYYYFEPYVVAYDGSSDTKERLEEAEREKEEKEAELQEAQNQLATTQSSLYLLEEEKTTYEDQMNSLNSQLQLVADNLAVIEAELDIKRIELEETTIALEEATQISEQQYESMMTRIQYMYEGGDETYVDILLSASSFGEFLNYANYVEQVSAYDRLKLEEYIATQQSISANKLDIEQELAEIEELEAEAEAAQQEVMGLINQTSASIAAMDASIDVVEAQKAEYEDECSQRQAEADAAAADYEAIKAQYEEELRLAQQAREAEWRDISQVTFDDGDRYLLANLIYCEAGGEPYDGQLAVASVVINRVLSSKYPDTVTGVIYQSYQFSPVNNGSLASALASDKATANCYAAADEAMSGVTNVGMCLYFRTPIEGLTGIEIGHHIFY